MLGTEPIADSCFVSSFLCIYNLFLLPGILTRKELFLDNKYWYTIKLKNKKTAAIATPYHPCSQQWLWLDKIDSQTSKQAPARLFEIPIKKKKVNVQLPTEFHRVHFIAQFIKAAGRREWYRGLEQCWKQAILALGDTKAKGHEASLGHTERLFLKNEQRAGKMAQWMRQVRPGLATFGVLFLGHTCQNKGQLLQVVLLHLKPMLW